MSIWRQLIQVARLVPSEFELMVHRKIMRIHRPEQLGGEAICNPLAHHKIESWPCDEFIRADRAVDDVLERRAV